MKRCQVGSTLANRLAPLHDARVIATDGSPLFFWSLGHAACTRQPSSLADLLNRHFHCP
jgi:hypothetical protein